MKQNQLKAPQTLQRSPWKNQAVSSYYASPRPLFTNLGLLPGESPCPLCSISNPSAQGLAAVAWGGGHSLQGQHLYQLEPGTTKQMFTSYSSKIEKKNIFPCHVYVCYQWKTRISFRLLWRTKEHWWCIERENMAEGSLQTPVQTPCCTQISNTFTRWRAEVTFCKY